MRTGYEATIAHRVGEEFSCVAKQNGRVISVDESLNLLKVEYAAQPIHIDGSRKLPFTEIWLHQALTHGSPLVMLMTEEELKNYPANKVFSVSSVVNVEMLEAILFQNLDAVPDKTALKFMTPDLVRQIKKDPNSPVIYVRMTPIGKFAAPVIDLFQFGAKYTNVSGSYLKQDIVINVKEGEVFKRGDVLAYNEGFFAPDPDSKQVSWKHGVMTNIALIEMGVTLEDSCSITKEFGERLSMAPAHVRQIEISANTVVYDIVKIGDHVESTDQLCIIEEGDIEALSGTDDASTLSFLSNLNKKVLRAKYHGEVAEIAMYYSCSEDALHPSLAKLARKLARQKDKYTQAAENTLKENDYSSSQQIPPGTKYRGTQFDNDTVLILITIAETLNASVGDKLVVALQAKSVIGEVMERPPSTESGVGVDMVFSSSSVARRILSSPYLIGTANRILEKMEADVTDIYFNE